MSRALAALCSTWFPSMIAPLQSDGLLYGQVRDANYRLTGTPPERARRSKDRRIALTQNQEPLRSDTTISRRPMATPFHKPLCWLKTCRDGPPSKKRSDVAHWRKRTAGAGVLPQNGSAHMKTDPIRDPSPEEHSPRREPPTPQPPQEEPPTKEPSRKEPSEEESPQQFASARCGVMAESW